MEKKKLKMRLVIPLECQIGGISFRIYYNDRLLEKMGLCAYISSKDQKIILTHRKTDQEFFNLIHEVVHGVVFENSIELGDNKEQTVSALGIGLATFLVSLGIEPDFSEIPEEGLDA